MSQDMTKTDPHKPDDEPAFRTFVIDQMNDHGARAMTMIAVRLPQPYLSHLLWSKHAWTPDQKERYINGDGSLPYTFNTASSDNKGLPVWIFDASGANGGLPVVEFDSPASFGKCNELCAFVLSSMDMPWKDRRYALVPSALLDFVEKGGKNVHFMFKDYKQTLESFVMEGGRREQ